MNDFKDYTFQDYANIALTEYAEALGNEGKVYPDEGNSTLINALAFLCHAEKYSKADNLADIERIRQWERDEVQTQDDCQKYSMLFWYAIAMIYGAGAEAKNAESE